MLGRCYYHDDDDRQDTDRSIQFKLRLNCDAAIRGSFHMKKQHSTLESVDLQMRTSAVLETGHYQLKIVIS